MRLFTELFIIPAFNIDNKTIKRMTNNNAASVPAELPVITTPRLRLRLPQHRDQDDLFRVFSAPEAMRYWSTPAYTEVQQVTALIDEIHAFCRQRRLFQWGIELGTEGRLIGTCTLAWLDWSNGRAEIGFILHPAYWRQGYITEALSGLLQHAFKTLQLRRIEADVDPRNAGSIATLEKLGFMREGLLRERWQVDNETQDSYFYGLLSRNWQLPSSA